MTAATAQRADWRAAAACAGMPLRTFFAVNTSPAREVCGRCPIRPECLYDALTHRAPHGIWGGLSREERLAVPKLPEQPAAAIACLSDYLATADELAASAPTPAPLEEPVTVQALKGLLTEIDRQGGPQAARENRLRLDGTDVTGAHMSTAPDHTPASAPAPAALVAVPTPAATGDAETLPVGQLLAWGDQHDDPDVQDQAGRARITLHGLRQRYATDQEMTSLTSEEQQLEQRLAELRARKDKLAPAKPKTKRQPVGYPAREVRAWAKANGHDCPATGRVPKKVVEAWRAATATAEPE